MALGGRTLQADRRGKENLFIFPTGRKIFFHKNFTRLPALLSAPPARRQADQHLTAV